MGRFFAETSLIRFACVYRAPVTVGCHRKQLDSASGFASLSLSLLSGLPGTEGERGSSGVCDGAALTLWAVPLLLFSVAAFFFFCRPETMLTRISISLSIVG